MSIEVTGPDGAIHEFPDDTSQAVIKNVMAARYGSSAPTQQTAVSPAMDLPNQGSIGLSRGALNLVGAPVDAVQAAERGLNKYVLGPLGYPVAAWEKPGPVDYLNSASLNQAAAQAIPGLNAAPQTTAGQYGRTIGETLAGALLMPGGGGLASNAIRYGLVPGTASELAGQLTQGTAAEPAARIAGGVGGALAAGLRRLPQGSAVDAVGNLKNAGYASQPTQENIEQLKTDAYKAAKDLNASYMPEAFQQLVNKISNEASTASERINPKFHPKAVARIEDMQNVANSANAPIPLMSLEDERKLVNRDVMSSPELGEQHFGSLIKRNIDQFIANPGSVLATKFPNLVGLTSADAMAAGNAGEAAQAITNARDLNTRYEKSRALADALDQAGLRASSSGIGGNLDNAIRQNARRVLGAEAWSPDEEALIRQTVGGTPLQNELRAIGRFSPLSGFIPALAELGAGVLSDHPFITSGVAATGAASKFAADRMTKANAANLMATILAGGKPPMAALPPPIDWQTPLLASSLGRIANRPNVQ